MIVNELELIKKAKNGDDAALDIFFNEYQQLVSRICRRFFLIGGDKDDIVQEGMLGLLKALNSYNSEKNASFKTFATLCINRQVINAAKKYSSVKNSPLNNGLSIDMEGGVKAYSSDFSEDEESSFFIIPSDELTPDEQLFSKEKLQIIYKHINEELSIFEKKVLSLYLQGRSITEISQILITNYKSVENSLQRTKSKLSYLKFSGI